MPPTTSVVDYGFEDRSSQTKDYKISICCFSTHTHARKDKEHPLKRHIQIKEQFR